jgi:penicillin-insensitive murein endopeptidase
MPAFGAKALARAFLLSLCLIPALLPAPATAAGDWSRVARPSLGPARVIGPTNNGCVVGAQALPLEGAGYLVMHLERRRYFGHPNLVNAIESLGRQAAARGLGPVQIGDLGQPRGGPMPFGHRSHQTGLDVDIWFNLNASLLDKADDARANVNAPSMLNARGNGLSSGVWSARHRQLLELAAKLPEADRIFVNPYIKRDLCEQAGAERGWLRKIRPWHRHDDHFHMRLACPQDSPACEAQDPIPAGDGCDASLDWWFQPHPPAPPAPPGPKPALPAACRALLD